MTLTVRSIAALKPGARRREIPDGAGLFLVVQPSGAMSWAYRFRSSANAKPKKLTLGRCPPVKDGKFEGPGLGLAEARKAAQSAATATSEGRDPGEEKKARRAAANDRSNLVNAQLDDFIKRHVGPNLRRSTAAEIERIFDREIRPVWGDRKISAITKRDVLELLDGIIDRGAATMANRVLAHVRSLFNWLVSRDVIAVSPVAGVKAPAAEVSRDRVLTDEEIRLFWHATEQTTALNCAARVMLLTGQRRGEVEGMLDAELDLEGAQPNWRIPKERTKNGNPHTVPLSPAAVAAIKAAPRIANSPIAFTTTGKTPVSGWSKVKRQIDEAMLAEVKEGSAQPDKVVIPDWRLHDLRRTAASGMARLGVPVHVVEAALNHRSGSVSGIAAVYNRYDYLDEKRRALMAWASFIEGTVATGPSANVVPIRTGR